jgi:protein TonB
MSDRSRWSMAIGLAFLIECGLVAGLNRILAMQPQTNEPGPVTVVFERPHPLPTLRPTPTPKPQPPVRRPEMPLVHPVPVTFRPRKVVPRPVQSHEMPLVARQNPRAPAAASNAQPTVLVAATPVPLITPQPVQETPSSPPPQTPAPLPAATSQSIDPAILAAYNAKLTAAVQAAFRVPGTAADIGFKGRVRIEFTLRSGVVMNVRVDVPSGLGAVDRAAVRAVQTANYPLPPQVLLGKDGTYQIWVACT